MTKKNTLFNLFLITIQLTKKRAKQQNNNLKVNNN